MPEAISILSAVRFTTCDLAAHPLRVGLSMRATVDTHDRNGHALDSEPPTPAVSTRVHDGVASEADAAAAVVIRENAGG